MFHLVQAKLRHGCRHPCVWQCYQQTNAVTLFLRTSHRSNQTFLTVLQLLLIILEKQHQMLCNPDHGMLSSHWSVASHVTQCRAVIGQFQCQGKQRSNLSSLEFWITIWIWPLPEILRLISCNQLNKILWFS